ncbi:AAA family ATPase [Kitasatospora sp. NPDC004669]|uniref:helix-turn-helix transcriptional regulator n=1 Tax=Kitasatospora sp. NPDC004669 TaxID=3154555 RepID=UPI0033B27669
MTTVLIDRGKELAALDAQLEAGRRGRCALALVSGAAGSGKTELLHAFAERATEQGAVVLTALACDARNAPLGALHQLVCSAPAAAYGPGPADAATRSLVAEAAAASAGAGGSGPVDFALLDALAAALARLARVQSVVIAVDDVQDADQASLDYLLHLIRRLRYARVLFVFNESEHLQGHNPRFRVELLRQPGFRRIRLGPLSVGGVERMLAANLGTTVPRASAVRYHEVSGGNPLLVRALLDDSQLAPTVGVESRPHGAIEVGDSFSQALLACLHRGNPTMLAVARALAVLDEPSLPETVERLLVLDRRSTVQAIEDLTAAGFVSDGGFRHPQARAAVLGELSAERRSELHYAAAQLLHAMGAPASDVAPHVLGAGDIDEPWVPGILKSAAEQALREGTAEHAIGYLERAERLLGGGPECIPTVMLLVGAQWRVNPALAVRHLDLLGEALAAGCLTGHQGTALVRFMLWHGRTEQVVAALVHLRRQAEQDTQVADDLTALVHWMRGTHPDALVSAGLRPVAALPWSGLASLGSRAATLFSTVLTAGPDERTVDRAERVLQATVLEAADIAPIEAALLSLHYGGQPDRAARWCDPLLDEALARDIPSWAARLASIRAAIAVREGDARAAEQHAETAMRLLAPRNWGTTVGSPLSVLLLARTALGKHEEAAELLNQPVPAAMFETRYGLHYRYARGRHYLATDRCDEALADFLACGDQMRAWGIDQPDVIPWRSAAADALLRLGEREQAARLAEEQLARLGSGRSRARGITLRTLAGVAAPESRSELLREAVANLKAADDRLELSYALSDLADLGDPGEVRPLVGEPEPLREQGAQQPLRLAGERVPEPRRAPLLRHVLPAAESPRRPVGHSGVGLLSEAELRVAALASLGCTNREIAGRLYITVSTVEQHLTRVYRKLKVSRRSDLPTDLQVPPSEPGPGELLGQIVVAYRGPGELVGRREVG